jgi:hypothetical protein
MRWTVRTASAAARRLGLEEFDFPNTSARYLRIIANGNSTSDWNSYYEVEIHGVIDCDFIIQAGCGLTSDWSGPNNVPDCCIDFYDFAAMGNGWLTSVDITDLAVLTIQWLQCNDPQNPDCSF